MTILTVAALSEGVRLEAAPVLWKINFNFALPTHVNRNYVLEP